MISYAIMVNDELAEIEKLIKRILSCLQEQEEDEIIVLQDLNENEVPINNKLKVFKYLTQLERKHNIISFYTHGLNNDFAQQKNYLNSLCKNPYIFNIDADEIPEPALITTVHKLIKEYPDVDAFWVPRINIVRGLTNRDIARYHWSIGKVDSIIEEKILNTNSDEYKILKKYKLIISESIINEKKFNNNNIFSDDIIIKNNIITKKAVKFYTPIVNWPNDPQLRIYKNNPKIKWKRSVHEVLTGYDTYAQLPCEEKWALFHEKQIDKQRKQNIKYNKIARKII